MGGGPDPLAKGEVLRLVPTPASGHPDLDVDGNLKVGQKLTINQVNAHKLFMVWADIVTSGAPGAQGVESEQRLDAHVPAAARSSARGRSTTRSCSSRSPTTRAPTRATRSTPTRSVNALIWDLRKEPGKKDMFWKTGSFMVGRQVDLATAEDHHFYSERYNTPLLHTEAGNTSGAFQPKLSHPTGSLIISPKQTTGRSA